MRVLITGGSGTLGGWLRRAPALEHHEVATPPRTELDVADRASVESWFERHRPELVIHAAARIRARGVDSPAEKADTSRVNVMGTGHVARYAAKLDARLVYVSTDFVFDGQKPGGMYSEDDVPAPLGYYPLTKLAGEALISPDALVVRTSFCQDGIWPYPGAFVDRFTSKLPASRAAAEIALAACALDLTGILHLGGERTSYFDYARRLRPDVAPLTMAEYHGLEPVPVDTSLDSGRWRRERERRYADG
jgi:RmlD substrate binding domain